MTQRFNAAFALLMAACCLVLPTCGRCCGCSVPLPSGAVLFGTSQLLTSHYEQCWKYYCLPSGWGSYGLAVEEELHLTEKLFWGIFDSLSHKVMVVLPKRTGRPAAARAATRNHGSSLFGLDRVLGTAPSTPPACYGHPRPNPRARNRSSPGFTGEERSRSE